MPTWRADGWLQLYAGLFNLWVWTAVAWAIGVGVFGAIDPLLGATGWLSCGLVPLGLIEVAWSLHLLRAGYVHGSRRLAVLQMFSILIGGLPSALVGGVVWIHHRSAGSSTSR